MQNLNPVRSSIHAYPRCTLRKLRRVFPSQVDHLPADFIERTFKSADPLRQPRQIILVRRSISQKLRPFWVEIHKRQPLPQFLRHGFIGQRISLYDHSRSRVESELNRIHLGRERLRHDLVVRPMHQDRHVQTRKTPKHEDPISIGGCGVEPRPAKESRRVGIDVHLNPNQRLSFSIAHPPRHNAHLGFLDRRLRLRLFRLLRRALRFGRHSFFFLVRRRNMLHHASLCRRSRFAHQPNHLNLTLLRHDHRATAQAAKTRPVHDINILLPRRNVEDKVPRLVGDLPFHCRPRAGVFRSITADGNISSREVGLRVDHNPFQTSPLDHFEIRRRFLTRPHP